MATTNLSLDTISSSGQASSFPATFNANMEKIDAIVEQTNTATGGYVKFVSGLMIQWGVSVLDVGSALSQIGSTGVYSGMFTFTLPAAFVNASFVMTGCCRYSTGHNVPFGAMANTASEAAITIYDFYARPASSTEYYIRWQAVGRWK